MKNIFVWINHLLFRYRKKLFYGALVFLICQICFLGLGFNGNEVFAVEGDTPSQNALFTEKASEWYVNLSFFQKVLYVLVYPLLFVAGKLVDNSLVYGEVLGFDTVLWHLWNIVRNLANFGLGFLLIYKIFEFLLSGKKSGNVKKILISALVAGIGIQASWFVMAALIDVSTILAYGVGGLPISVLKGSGTEDDLKYNPYILKSAVYFEVDDFNTLSIYLTDSDAASSGTFYISECHKFSYKYDGKSEDILLAPEMIYYADEKGEIHRTEKLKCHLFGQVYYFSDLYDIGESYDKINGEIREKEQSDSGANITDYKTWQLDYSTSLSEAETKIKGDLSIDEISNLINSAVLLEVGNAHVTGGVMGELGTYPYTQDKVGLDLYNRWTGSGKASRLQDILDGNSYVGVFTALYTSLINSVGIIPQDAGTYAALLNVALSFGHMLAISIPLIAVAVLFMLRIGVLWVAIVISPFIVLVTAFNYDKSVFKGKFWEYFNVKNLISIIFSPAIICFAISISTVLVTIISGLNVEKIETEQSEILGGLIKLNIGGLTVPMGKLIVSVFGIAITWFLVWAAVEASKLGKDGIIGSIKKLATNTLGSMPIVPIVGKGADGELTTTFVGTKTAFGLGNGGGGIVSKMMNMQKSEYERNDSEVVQDIINPDRVRIRRDEAYKAQIVNLDASNTQDWTKQVISIGDGTSKMNYTFDDVVPSRKKEIIEAINGISDENRRKAFGQKKTISFDENGNSVTYEFNKKGDNKYDLL